MLKKRLGSLLISITIILLSSYSVHATMYNYVGAGTITTDDTVLNITLQIDIDSYLYPWWDLETPVLSDPDVPLTQIHKMPMENGTMYIEGYGLYENVTGSLGGFLALEDLNDPSTDYLATMNQGFNFSSPDVDLFGGADHQTSFYNYDGTPYSGLENYVREPWTQEYGMCAPILVIQDLGSPQWLFGDWDVLYDLELTLVRQPTEPVPVPATILLLGSGLIGLAGLGRKKFKR